MKVSDIRLEMELGGVDEKDIAEIVALFAHKALNVELIDEELLKRGYEKIFTVDYDEYNEWEDDDYMPIEKFPHKHYYAEWE
jgi:hypothetical protein